MLQPLKILSARTYTALGAFGLILWFPKDWEDRADAWAVWARWLGVLDQQTLLWIFAAVLLVWLVWTDVRPFIRGKMQKKFPPRHAEVCAEIARELRQLRTDALDAPNWVDSDAQEMDPVMWLQFKHTASHIDSLLGEISYDPVTDEAVRSFMSRCASMVMGTFSKEQTEGIQREIREMAAPLFQSLHTGKPLSPASIPAPRWPEGIELETQQ